MVLLVAVLGVLWHAALVMLNDGLRREQYRRRVLAIRALPTGDQSAARVALKAWSRRRITPVGLAFSRAWQRRHPGRGAAGRASHANERVNWWGRAEWLGGAALLTIMVAWLMIGRTPAQTHVCCLLGGTIGGILLGAAASWAGVVLTTIAHVVGAGGGAVGAAGIAGLTEKL